MNTSGKTITIFIILIDILLLCSTSIGFYLYHLEQRLHKKDKIELENSRSDGQKLQAQIKDIQGQLALAEDKNKEADQKINNLLDEKDLNEGLRTALKKENVKLKDQLAQMEDARQKMKAQLDDANGKWSQDEQLLKSSQDKEKAFESRLADLVEAKKNLETKVNELKAQQSVSAQPPIPQDGAAVTAKDKIELDKIVVNPQDGTKGHVLSIDIDADFVIINLGLKQGVKPDDMLSIYRGDEYLGDVKATRVQDEMSAADIIPPLSSRELRKNDTVVLKP